MARGIRRTREGAYMVRLEPHERELLGSLPGQLRHVIAVDDPSTRRLFPPAFDDDEAAQAEYRELVHDGLVSGKLAALDVLERTASAEELTEEEVGAWLGAFESLRLVLGSQLDVQEDTYADGLDPAHPDAARLALYGWLSWLQEEAVAALSAGLPGPT